MAAAAAVELHSMSAPADANIALLVAAAVLAVFSFAVHKDYNDFKALGPGGTPSTVPGYLRIKFLGLFALRNPCKPARIPWCVHRGPYLSKLSKRHGARPTVRGIAPHRQINQKIDASTFASLRAAVVELADDPQNRLRAGTSCLEKYGPGLFALEPFNRTSHCNAELCHAHPSDGSLHVVLHPADVRLVLQRGWGERHPLSSGGWLTRFIPEGFTMVYAPRNEQEVEVVQAIVKAAVWWVAGIDVDSDDKPKRPENLGGIAALPGAEGVECLIPNLIRNI